MPKKTFANSMPAELFLNTEPEQASAPERTAEKTILKGTKPAGYYLDPKFIEAKTRRVQLLIKPSLYDKAKTQADKQGISVNEYINGLIEKDS